MRNFIRIIKLLVVILIISGATYAVTYKPEMIVNVNILFISLYALILYFLIKKGLKLFIQILLWDIRKMIWGLIFLGLAGWLVYSMIWDWDLMLGLMDWKLRDSSVEQKIRIEIILYCINVFIYSLIMISLFFKTTRQIRVTKNYIHLKIFGGKIPIFKPFEHILIVGGSGSGKTQSVINPLMKEMINRNFSGVIYDYKSPKLERVSRGMYDLSKNKSRYLTLNMSNPSCSDRFNLLKNIRSELDCREIAMQLLQADSNNKKKDPFFDNAATAYLTAIIYYLKDKAPSLPHIISYTLQQPADKIIETLKKNPISMQLARPVIDSQGSEKQLSGITAQVSSNLINYLNEGIYYVLSGDESLDISNQNDPKILAISNDPLIENALSPIISAIFLQITRLTNQSGKNRSFLILDEFSTLRIPNFNKYMSTVRENFVSCILAFQDYSQLGTVYDNDMAATITANCAYKFFGKNTNSQTIESMKKTFGNYLQTHETYSGTGLWEKRSTNETLIMEDKITNEQIINLTPGQFFTIGTGIIQKKRILPYRFKQTEIKPSNIEEQSHSSSITEEFNKINIEASELS